VPLRTPGLKERVAREILAAAARVLASTGNQASMNDVASAAGVARGTLYRYFPTREALVKRLRETAAEDAAGRMKASRVDEVEPLEGLERAIRVFVDMGALLVVSARERDRNGGDEFDTAIMGPLRALIERGQAGGVIRDDMSPWWLAESFLGLAIVGSPAGRLGKEDTIAWIRRLFLEGARQQ
jgi:AcrR family transcriptional regulator